MRKILFRGKRENGKWAEGYLFKSIFGNYNIRTLEEIDGDFYTDDYIVESETVGQYIGKNDINDKKVFDGDIVKLNLEEGIEIGHIALNEENYRYVFVGVDGIPYGIDSTVKLEVIGNIYDNPELLKGGEG